MIGNVIRGAILAAGFYSLVRMAVRDGILDAQKKNASNEQSAEVAESPETSVQESAE